MMNDTTWTPAELDRLIDDECDDAARQDLLRRIEASGDWRSLAMTFLETQALRRSVRALCRGSELGNAPHIEIVRQVKDEHQQVARSKRNERLKLLAAGLVAIVLAGVWISGALRTPLSNRSGPNEPLTRMDQQPAKFDGSLLPDDELPESVQWIVNDGHSDVPQIINVPIDTRSQPMDFANWEPRSALSEEMRQRLADSGHDVEESASLFPVTLPNGRSVVFPVNQVRVNYRGPQWHQ